ncbi:MAG: SMP-30/gluconolactonase/LRE family protein [bacterium]|nr:SMP-30/gluconolactonase/LRE family protein [bacterium]
MKKTVMIALVLLAGLVAWLLLTPSPIDAVAWQPAKAPAFSGVLAVNKQLQKAELLARGKIHGPEDIAIDAQGRVHAGLADGRIVRLDGDKVTTLANTGGRPLGMVFDAAGNLVICDSWKGLLQLAPDGRMSTLVTAVDGVPLSFTDDLDIASDGKIYFTDASTKYHQPDYVLDLLEGRPYGRLYVYDPATRTARLLLKDLYFANGVALSKNQDAVFISETYRYRIRKFWLSGPKAGTDEIIADNLPGLPDNINSDRNGIIWIALPSPRKAIADVSASNPWMRKLMVKLPRAFWPKPDRYGLAIAIDENGRIIRSMHDASGDHLRMITSVYPYQGHLYFGSLENDRIGKL